MKSRICFAFSILLLSTSIVTAQEEEDESKHLVEPRTCPNFQLRCPPCAENETCVYPDSGNCEGAGIPICQSSECDSTACLSRRIQCPKECPFSCRYDGPPCCPFNGEPVCEPVCQTFVPCAVTPCPDDCPDDCFYPEADLCCPNSGQAVCKRSQVPLTEDVSNVLITTITSTVPQDYNSKKWRGGKGYKSGGDPRDWVVSYDGDYEDWVYPEDYYYGGPGLMAGYFDGYEGGYDGGFYYDYDGEDDDEGDEDNDEDEDRRHSWRHHRHHHGHRHENDDEDEDEDENEYYEGLFIGGAPQRVQHCPTCTKVVTDVEVSLDFATTTKDPSDIVCAQFIVPCPIECPYNCIYPMDQPCPFTEQPWCPSILDMSSFIEPECDTVYETKGYPFPYFPVTDPYYSVFTSILNNSGITSTPSFVTETATTTPEVFCPLIYIYCPIECPDSCLRLDIPCPFAVDGYCPGSSPTTTIVDETALITSTAETVIGDELVCPLYLLGCPVCPEDYTCTRENTGRCPNTNVPYCVSTISPEVFYDDPWYEFDAEPTEIPSMDDYYRQGDGRRYGYEKHDQALHAQSLLSPSKSSVNKPKDNMRNACARSGLTRISTRQVFEQLQEKRADCDHCLVLEWNEECENTCVYRNEDDCCLKTICLPN